MSIYPFIAKNTDGADMQLDLLSDFGGKLMFSPLHSYELTAAGHDFGLFASFPAPVEGFGEVVELPADAYEIGAYFAFMMFFRAEYGDDA